MSDPKHDSKLTLEEWIDQAQFYGAGGPLTLDLAERILAAARWSTLAELLEWCAENNTEKAGYHWNAAANSIRLFRDSHFGSGR
jgi:hypothetical protein